MNITIKINCDNAAFEDTPGSEIARILRKLADRVDGDSMSEEDGCRLLDINGNKVGSMEVQE